ncbi:Molybdopterin synthase catalytic subunit [Actinomortierella ambigua]|uniref:Molybdopterin synthase catalytic subunit n=1 Tax=Actinomortierella ambigua TaxID=1343610 RepID=A0A9P6QLR4_9FUNG|nr:Molybdopterin synthase catalytic subunit [Actinomortierella ambigua]KAG0269310.1 Molybdopterin synthase catalytic subunit [Actinomortierella ambigua]
MTSNHKDFVCITSDPIRLEAVANLVHDPKAGAVSTFSGTTRDNFEDKVVKTLAYEAYIPMAEKSIQGLIDEARVKFDIMHVAIYHKIGDCPVGDTSVVIAVSSAHRRSGLEAVSWLIDELKVKVPIWKKEVYSENTGGGATWKANSTLP